MRNAPSPPVNAVAQTEQLISNVSQAVLGKEPAIELVTIALFAGGHVLIEDVPGTGKTTLARALARSLDCSFQRIQFTADLLPTDILGVSLPDPQTGQLAFHPGPIFASVILADELNRCPPRTQSALLQCMGEGKVSIEGATRPLPDPFFVLATQNPLEQAGTFPLPDSQLDRFMLRLHLGYPDADSESRILLEEGGPECIEGLAPVLTPESIRALQDCARGVHTTPAIAEYVRDLLQATRQHADLVLGASPRAGRSLLRAARARAMVRGRDYCTVDDVQELAESVLTHRLRVIDAPTDGQASADVLREILNELPVPI